MPTGAGIAAYLSGSIVLPQLGYMLMSKTYVVTKGQEDAYVLSYHFLAMLGSKELKCCWDHVNMTVL